MANLKPRDVAKKYLFPLPASLSRSKIHAPATPVNVDSLLRTAQTMWKDDPFSEKYYAHLTGSDHADFTSQLLSVAKYRSLSLRDQKHLNPIVVKSTTASRNKARSKFDQLKKPSSSAPSNLPAALPTPITKSHYKCKDDIEKEKSKGERDLLFLKKMSTLTILQRSKSDQDRLIRLLRANDGFKMISDVFLEQMCVVGSVIYAPEDSFVCDYATTNSIWYCVLSGSVQVELSREAERRVGKRSKENMLERIKIDEGTSFGVLDKKTTKSTPGSVTALRNSLLFRIDSHDYFRAATFANEKAQRAAFVKIKGLSLFEGVSQDAFDSFAVMMTLQSFKKGDSLCKQGATIEKAAIIIEGSCKVIVQFPNNGPTVTMGILNVGDYFGEQLWLKECPNVFTFSVIAQTNAKIILFSHNTAIQSKMMKSKYTEASQSSENLEEWKQDCKLQRFKDRERKKQLIILTREFRGNPRILTIQDCNELYQK